MGREHTRQTSREDARIALDKSEEFLEMAQRGLAAGKWSATGLTAIHSGIAAADAALIAAAGVRSISQDHGAVIDLLESQPASEFGSAQRRQLAGLLKMKNQVAYDQRLLTEVEARQLVDHAARLAKWAAMVVNQQLGPRSSRTEP